MTDVYDFQDDDQDIKDIDFSEGELDINWFSKIDAVRSQEIMEDGEMLGKFDDTGSTWWRVVKYKNEYFISLTDLDDVFEVNKTILDRV